MLGSTDSSEVEGSKKFKESTCPHTLSHYFPRLWFWWSEEKYILFGAVQVD